MNPPLRIVFAGTPDFAVPSLHACITSGAQVVAVYTQPDRASGRGRKLSASPVKQAAQAAGVAVEQPESLRDVGAQTRLREYAPDLLIVVAYGLILPRTVLAMPRLGGWNVHASLLPRWRGAAPIQRAILAGDHETGVALMQMQAGLDTGPVLIEKRTPIAADETAGTLHDRLATLGAQVLGAAVACALHGEVPTAVAQAAHGANYAHKIDKAEARLDWNDSAEVLARKIRAFDPWPVAEAIIDDERVHIWSADAVAGDTNAAPGQVAGIHRDAIDIATGAGLLRIREVQRDSGRRIQVRDWLNARRNPGLVRG